MSQIQRLWSATFELDPGETVTCTFINTRPRPVGGVIVPASRLELLAPWLGLVALVSLAGLTVALIRRRGG